MGIRVGFQRPDSEFKRDEHDAQQAHVDVQLRADADGRSGVRSQLRRAAGAGGGASQRRQYGGAECRRSCQRSNCDRGQPGGVGHDGTARRQRRADDPRSGLRSVVGRTAELPGGSRIALSVGADCGHSAEFAERTHRNSRHQNVDLSGRGIPF